MAKAKFGMIVTDMRNKLGGHVFSKNRSGSIVRTKVTPSNPQTIAQMQARGILASMSTGWAGITQSQRNAWNEAVTDWQKTDVFGDLKKPSGKNLYVSLNSNLAQLGTAPIDSPPAKADVPFVLFTDATIGIAAGEITFGGYEVPAGYEVQISSTGPVSAGVEYVKGRFRVIDFAAAGTIDPDAAYLGYTTKFGVPVIGQKIFIQLRLINATTGQAGVPAVVQAAVMA